MTDWVRWGFDLGSSGLNDVEDGSGNNISTDLISGGEFDGEPKIAQIDLLWTSPLLDGKVQCQVVKVGSYVYAVTRAGTLYKLSFADGSIVGSCALGAPSSSTPHIDSGIAYLNTDATPLQAIDTSTMTNVWTADYLDNGGSLYHPVVSGSNVYTASTAGFAYGVRKSDGHTLWIAPIVDEILGNAAQGPLSFWSSKVYVPGAGTVGVVELDPSTGDRTQTFGARNTCYGVAIQAHTNGTDFLCFESEDHWVYAYDRATGERLWMEDHQGGDMKCPVGLDLTRVGTYATGFAIPGTHNWSIQPHAAPGGDLIWKRDASPSPAPSGAIVSGYAIANGVFGGVWPPNDGRLAFFVLDQSRGGHTADWKFGTFTGVQGGGNSANKNCATPIIIDGTIVAGFDDKFVRAFA